MLRVWEVLKLIRFRAFLKMLWLLTQIFINDAQVQFYRSDL